jgi:hypothetical protein
MIRAVAGVSRQPVPDHAASRVTGFAKIKQPTAKLLRQAVEAHALSARKYNGRADDGCNVCGVILFTTLATTGEREKLRVKRAQRGKTRDYGRDRCEWEGDDVGSRWCHDRRLLITCVVEQVSKTDAQ